MHVSTLNRLSPRKCGPLLPTNVLPAKIQLYPTTPPAVTSLSSSTSTSLPSTSLELTPVKSKEALKPSSIPNKSPHISLHIQKLVAVTSVEFERYERDETSDRYYYAGFMIPALETKFYGCPPPNNWIYHVHPEGAPYFHNNLWNFPILTDVYIYEEAARKQLETYINQIHIFINDHNIKLPSNIQLVLEFRNSGNCGYYFVDHGNQCLFWLEEFDAMVFLAAVKVKYSRTHIGLAMKSLYWCHNMLFPDLAPFAARAAAISEVKDALLHTIGDTLTSSTSNVSFSREDAQHLLPLVKEIELEGENIVGSGPISVLYRLLQKIYNERFLNLYGEKCARLDSDHSIHPQQKGTLIMKLLSPIVLFGWEMYYEKLRKISVDSFVQKSAWENLKQEIIAEWNANILYATVLLNANVAFLAIQSVDTAAPPHGRTISQRASYLSVVNSLGVIILGLLLIRQHNTVLDRAFLVGRSTSVYGLENLALMYSLPYALLMWGLVSFLTAFSSMCFTSHDVITEIIMSTTWFMFICLLIWCISVTRENTQFYYPWPFRRLPWWREQMYKGLILLDEEALPASTQETSCMDSP